VWAEDPDPEEATMDKWVCPDPLAHKGYSCEEETTKGVVGENDPHRWEQRAMNTLPHPVFAAMCAILEKESDLLSVEPFWHHLQADSQGSKGSYEIRIHMNATPTIPTVLPFPVQSFQHAYELIQRLVERGHEVKLHHVGDVRFDGQILWVKA